MFSKRRRHWLRSSFFLSRARAQIPLYYASSTPSRALVILASRRSMRKKEKEKRRKSSKSTNAFGGISKVRATILRRRRSSSVLAAAVCEWALSLFPSTHLLAPRARPPPARSARGQPRSSHSTTGRDETEKKRRNGEDAAG